MKSKEDVELGEFVALQLAPPLILELTFRTNPLSVRIGDICCAVKVEDASETESLSTSSGSVRHRIKRGALFRKPVPMIWFFFIVGTMCSSKCSIAMDEMSRSSCSSS